MLIRGIARWLVWICELRCATEGTLDRLISMGAVGTLGIVYMHLPVEHLAMIGNRVALDVGQLR